MINAALNRHLRGSASGAISGVIVAALIIMVSSYFIGGIQLKNLQALEAEIATSPSVPVVMERIDRSTCGYLLPDASELLLSRLLCASCVELASSLHAKYEVTLQGRDGCTRGPYNTLQFARKP